MEAIVITMSVLAFGIACGTLAYNVHEFRHMSKEIGGMISEFRRESHKDHMAIVAALRQKRSKS